MKKNCKRLIIAALAAAAALLLAGCPHGGDDDEDVPEITLTESQSERRLESFDENGTLKSWNFDEHDELLLYSVYEYDATEATQLNKVSMYTAIPADASTLPVMEASYLYADAAADYATSGRLCAYNATSEKFDDVLERFVATYNANGDYSTMIYYMKNSDGVEELEKSRVCSYNANGQYETESFYADEANTDLLESYNCYYDDTLTWKYLREERYYKIPTDDPEYSYERNLTYLYSWDDHDNMYLQAEFDETGSPIGSILLTHELFSDESWYRSSMGSLNQNGLNALYRSYEYDPSTLDLIEINYYNKAGEADKELLARDVFQYFVRDGEYMYQNIYYVYTYSSKALGVGDQAGRGSGRLQIPPAAHHFEG